MVDLANVPIIDQPGTLTQCRCDPHRIKPDDLWAMVRHYRSKDGSVPIWLVSASAYPKFKAALDDLRRDVDRAVSSNSLSVEVVVDGLVVMVRDDGPRTGKRGDVVLLDRTAKASTFVGANDGHNCWSDCVVLQ